MRIPPPGHWPAEMTVCQCSEDGTYMHAEGYTSVPFVKDWIDAAMEGTNIEGPLAKSTPTPSGPCGDGLFLYRNKCDSCDSFVTGCAQCQRAKDCDVCGPGYERFNSGEAFDGISYFTSFKV